MVERQDGVIDATSILRTIDRVANLPTIPRILSEVNRMLQDEDVSVRKMADAIESDQAITSRILKLVNSAFYGFRSRIIDVRQAVMILGFNTVRNAVSAVSVVDLFRVREKYDGFDIKELWKHSIAVAATSKYLAERSRLAMPDDCLTAGLLHDIGKLVMAEYLPEIFRSVLKSKNETGLSFLEAEKKITAVDHAEIGGYLTQKWQFPRRLTDAIMCHHSANGGAGDFWLHACVFAANVIVNHRSDTHMIRDMLQDCIGIRDMLSKVGAVSEWYPAVAVEIEQANNFFLEDDSL